MTYAVSVLLLGAQGFRNRWCDYLVLGSVTLLWLVLLFRIGRSDAGDLPN